MDTSDDLSALYFYLHFPIIYDLGVLVPLTSFKMEFLIVINVAPSQITPNVWGIVRAFHIVCHHLGAPPFVKVLLYFFRTESNPSSGWVTLYPFPGVNFLKPFDIPYEDWKHKFSRIRRIDNVSPVIVGEGGEPMLPSSWTPKSKSTVRVDSCVLPPVDREVIHYLEHFLSLECNTLITRDREDDNGVEEYLCKGKYVLPSFYLCRRALIIYHTHER